MSATISIQNGGFSIQNGERRNLHLERRILHSEGFLHSEWKKNPWENTNI